MYRPGLTGAINNCLLKLEHPKVKYLSYMCDISHRKLQNIALKRQ